MNGSAQRKAPRLLKGIIALLGVGASFIGGLVLLIGGIPIYMCAYGACPADQQAGAKAFFWLLVAIIVLAPMVSALLMKLVERGQRQSGAAK